MDQLLSIGDFSAQCGLSPKVLRSYAAIGLLPPAAVDASSGYRYYSVQQLPSARIISLLRQAGIAVDDISGFFHEPEGDHFTRWDTALATESASRRQFLTQARAAVTLGQAPPPQRPHAHTKGSPMTMTWRTGTSTHIGGRSTNEDAVLIGDDLFAVADGIGGLPNGDEASRLALATLEAAFATNATVSGLLAACREANLAIWEWAAAQRDDVSMGTTVVALARTDDVGPVVVHAGDSRLYRIRQGHWEQLTGDHTITADLVRTGELAPDQSDGHPYQHVLTRALGVGPDVDIDLSGVSCRAGDRLVLCTDGLFKALSSDELAAGIPPGATPQQAADQLVEVAVANGAEDNVTVLVIDVG